MATKKKVDAEPVSLLARLKRHHVFRVASFYATLAYVLILVANAVFPDVGLTREDVRYVIAGLALGFPVVLTLSWMFIPPSREDPQQFSRWRRLRWKAGAVASLIVIAFVLGSGAYLWRLDERHLSTAPADVTALAAIPAKSVAVLPFENLSADPNNVYFASGMQDMILTKLADIGDIRTVSRTSTERYSSHPDDLKTIAQKLGVATILEGSVQKAGNQVLINVQLIDATTDDHLWAQAYTRTLDNIFGVEGEVAQNVAMALNAKLTPHESEAIAKVPTRNTAALDAYLQGQYHLRVFNRSWDRKELQLAYDKARQAVALDPGFADAYTLLARVSSDHTESMAAIKKALSLDPDNASAHVSMAFLLSAQQDNDGAIGEAKQAVLLQPSNWQVQQPLGLMFVRAGRFDEGIVALQRAVTLAPNETEPRVHLGQALVYVRRYAEARDALQIAIAMDPDTLTASIWLVNAYDFGWGDVTASHRVLAAVTVPVSSSFPLMSSWYWHDLLARDFAAARAVSGQVPSATFTEYRTPKGYYLGLSYVLQGNRTRARPLLLEAQTELEGWIKASPEDAELHSTLGEVLAGLGAYARALVEARRAVALMPVSKSAESGVSYLGNLAYVEMCASDTDGAIRQLRALLAMPAGTEVSVASLRIDPEWDAIRNDPRFKALLAESAPAPR